ncbi:hypothetical protein OUZ56_007346 [Daphnia magna]|uniref:Uncharacterized protein n=2 Tax=Daphnia magna TaxID=35525 RepID=A0ABR0A9N9_9CRUS|nr:hypothetical protein OUZ56_007346 [Daphnia magna]
MSNGVSESFMTHLKELSSTLPELFALKQSFTPAMEISTANKEISKQPSFDHLEVDMLKDLIENNSDMRTDPEPEYCIVKTSLHVHQAEKSVDFLTSDVIMSDDNQQLNDADYDGFQGTTVLDVTDSSSLSSNILSFTRILQHWAASTNQKKSHLTYLLQLLKEHKPLI